MGEKVTGHLTASLQKLILGRLSIGEGGDAVLQGDGGAVGGGSPHLARPGRPCHSGARSTATGGTPVSRKI